MKVLPCATPSWPLVEGAAGDWLDASLLFPCVKRSVENNLYSMFGFHCFSRRILTLFINETVFIYTALRGGYLYRLEFNKRDGELKEITNILLFIIWCLWCYIQKSILFIFSLNTVLHSKRCNQNWCWYRIRVLGDYLWGFSSPPLPIPSHL